MKRLDAIFSNRPALCPWLCVGKQFTRIDSNLYITLDRIVEGHIPKAIALGADLNTANFEFGPAAEYTFCWQKGEEDHPTSFCSSLFW